MVMIYRGRWRRKLSYLSTKYANGAMTKVATACRQTTRTQWLMPRLKATMQIMYMPAQPNWRETMAKQGFATLKNEVNALVGAIFSSIDIPLFLSSSFRLNQVQMMMVCAITQRYNVLFIHEKSQRCFGVLRSILVHVFACMVLTSYSTWIPLSI